MSFKKVALSIVNLPKTILKKIYESIISLLTSPINLYKPSEVTNLKLLKARLKPGDVILVSGNSRISFVVKLLTVSQWSHVVLYVGDKRELLSTQQKDEWVKLYGAEALKSLVIDADPARGVHLRPVDEYCGLMCRHCRPEALKPKDTERVIAKALEELGREYDLIHILRLLLFFAFPWSLLPHFLRRFITDFTISETDRICSRLLSDAFHSVGYPIRPRLIIHDRGRFHSTALGLAFGLKHRSRSTAKLLAGGRITGAMKRLADFRYTEIHLKVSRHITPADYDLSRFFSVIKDSEDLSIDYERAKALCPVD